MPDFNHYYRTIFSDRWEPLKTALLAPPARVARIIRFQEGIPPAFQDQSPFPGFLPDQKCYFLKAETEIPSSVPIPSYGFYIMDPASIVPVLSLGVRSTDRTLDLCAAPGGKSLILAEKTDNLICNDRSSRRRARLKQVLKDHLPPDICARIRVTGHDATKWSLHEKDAYDRILLDAPCSSEQHVLQKPKELAKWTPARSRQLAVRQYAMLAAALDACRPGGKIVYSTCALNSQENDGVIAKLQKKRNGQFQICRESPYGEETGYGYHILPDNPDTQRWGPIYVSTLQKST